MWRWRIVKSEAGLCQLRQGKVLGHLSFAKSNPTIAGKNTPASIKVAFSYHTIIMATPNTIPAKQLVFGFSSILFNIFAPLVKGVPYGKGK